MAFNRKTDLVAMELRIAPVDVIELRRLAGLPEDLDTAVGGIDLNSKHIQKIEQWISEVLNTDRYCVQFDETALPFDFDD